MPRDGGMRWSPEEEATLYRIVMNMRVLGKNFTEITEHLVPILKRSKLSIRNKIGQMLRAVKSRQ